MNRIGGSDDAQSNARLVDDGGDTQDTLELVEIALTQYTRRQTAENAQFTGAYKKLYEEAEQRAKYIHEAAESSWQESMERIHAYNVKDSTRLQNAEKLFEGVKQILNDSIATLVEAVEPEEIEENFTHDDVGHVVQSVYEAQRHAINKARRRAVKQHHRQYRAKQEDAESIADAKRFRSAAAMLLHS